MIDKLVKEAPLNTTMPHHDDFISKHEEAGHKHHSDSYSKHAAGHKKHADHIKSMCKGGMAK
jgi:hypothetical protein